MSIKYSTFRSFGKNLLTSQKNAQKVRSRMKQEGLNPCPMIIFSPSKGSLDNNGADNAENTDKPLSPEEIEAILRNVVKIGISVNVFAGRFWSEHRQYLDTIISAAKSSPETLYILFVPPTLIDDALSERFVDLKNLLVLISASESRSDDEYIGLCKACRILSSHKLFFGCYLTVSKKTLETCMSEELIGDLHRNGALTFFFADNSLLKDDASYTSDASYNANLISPDERSALSERMKYYDSKFSAFFLSVGADDKGRIGYLQIDLLGNIIMHNTCNDVKKAPHNIRNVSMRSLISPQ